MTATDEPILTVPIADEADVVTARQRARRVAELLGFDSQDQTRIATAVSEIARNAFEYAHGGRASFALRDGGQASQALAVRIVDRGPGIADADAVMEGRYRSRTGMGVGLVGARRLVDDFALHTRTGAGTTVELAKALPRRRDRITRERLGEVVAQLAREQVSNPLEILGEQNRELVQSLDELTRLNQELAETNRGVVALYAELDTRAEQLREASEAKSRFLSNMSHEFRTPLNSVLALSRLLLDRVDGELTPEQERQVGYIRASAAGLANLVNDLLDLAKVEAGRTDVSVSSFTVGELFGGLRGALKPLKTNPQVELNFIEAPDIPPLSTDEAKVAQILRNLVSNALKFTSKGEVRVSAAFDAETDQVALSVADTGVGIALGDQPKVFEEFTQLANPLQQAAKGTGLGLPLSRRLAELLGGAITLDSAPGRGSTFTLTLPRVFTDSPDTEASAWPAVEAERSRAGTGPILIIDDDEPFRYVLRELIQSARGEACIIEAGDGTEGLRLARGHPPPDLIFLDLQMPGLDGFAVLRALQDDPLTQGRPVAVVTSMPITGDLRQGLAGARAVLSKDALTREAVAALLAAAG